MIGITKEDSVAKIAVDLGVTSSFYSNVYDMIDVLWDSYVDKNAVYPRLTYAYTLRDAASSLCGELRTNIDVEQLNSNAKLNQLFTNAEKLRRFGESLIANLEERAGAVQSPASGLFKDDTSNNIFAPNPNSPGYRGDPIINTSWGSKGWW